MYCYHEVIPFQPSVVVLLTDSQVSCRRSRRRRRRREFPKTKQKKGAFEKDRRIFINKMNYRAALCYFLLLLCPSNQATPELTRTFSDGDKRVLIFDKLLPSEVVRSFYDLVTSGKVAGKISSWFYTYSDYYQDIGTLNTSSNSPWIAPVNPEFFSNTALWNISRKVVEEYSGGKGYFPYDVSFSMHRRLDFITATNKGKEKHLGELIFFPVIYSCYLS